jgi:membrane associated rhomboid family serine protease
MSWNDLTRRQQGNLVLFGAPVVGLIVMMAALALVATGNLSMISYLTTFGAVAGVSTLAFIVFICTELGMNTVVGRIREQRTLGPLLWAMALMVFCISAPVVLGFGKY